MSLKLLSESITFVFNIMFYRIESYNKQGPFFSEGKSFLTILNNKLFIESIKNIKMVAIEQHRLHALIYFLFTQTFTMVNS